MARLQIFNPDGSEAELSGNGAREAVLYLRRRGWTDQDRFRIQTAAGDIHPEITSDTTCRLAIGRVRLQSPDYPTGGPDGAGRADRGWPVLATFSTCRSATRSARSRWPTRHELEALDLAAIGPGIEHHELFPHRTNVSWYVPLASDRIRARIFERGVGETSASGTGACGAAVAHVLRRRRLARHGRARRR